MLIKTNLRKYVITIMRFLILLITIYLSALNIYSQVIEEWVARYNGPRSGSDNASAITIDNSANIYVTGGSDFSFVSNPGNFATIKYNSQGGEQWVAIYNGFGYATDYAYDIVVDFKGNIYVTGYSSVSETLSDYATIKYNFEGVQRWESRYNGPDNNNDYASAIATDNLGNVYVTGSSKSSETGWDYVTIKYDGAGVQRWAVRYNVLANGDDRASDIALDSFGNVYVTGYSHSSGTDYDYATVKYNNSGVEQWAMRYNSPDNMFDEARAIALDSTDNVYVTGSSRNPETFDNYVTVKYNSEGQEQWVAIYNGPGNYDDDSYDIAVSKSGDIYITGNSYGLGTNFDYATIKYNNAGVEQWVARYNHTVNQGDYAKAMAIDNSDNVYVTGHSYGAGNNYDYATVKYNNSGKEKWVTRYNGPTNGEDRAVDVVADNSGNVYVTGESCNIGTNYDYVTIKYSESVSITPNIWMDY